MLSKGSGWPGLAYRQATEADVLEKFGARYKKILFCGFNALNTAEIKIFKKLFESGRAEMLWDADTYYLENSEQEAGLFLRNNLRLFPVKEPFFINNYFKEEKTINIISVPKQLGQGQVVRQSLQELHRQGISFDKVAVVLANEKLLWPVLQQLPDEVQHLNITMEYPLRFTASYDLVETILQLQYNYTRQQRTVKTLYHKDLAMLLRQPLFQQYLQRAGASRSAVSRMNDLNRRNLAFLTPGITEELFGEDWNHVSPLLVPQTAPALRTAIVNVLDKLLKHNKSDRSGNGEMLEAEHITILLKAFNRLEEIMAGYPHFKDIGAFRQLFVQVTGSGSVPFLGEPLQGLQIMGVLETRTLDFEHLILVNVNEGVLPSGRSINSFIPNDLKSAAGMPLYTEKDAVYAYHFYRLLQRAKTVTITYDSETDTFGKGEKSRFVTQLLLELQKYNSQIKITEATAIFPGLSAEPVYEVEMNKSEILLENIVKKAVSDREFASLSPSSLIMFKQCSLRFYLRYGVQLKETEAVEENPEAGTFGSILHLSLEKIYKPFAGQLLNPANLRKTLPLLDKTVEESFKEVFEREELSGKSLLQLEVIKVYVKKLINQDLAFMEELGKSNRQLQILHLEHELSAALDLPGDPSRIFVKGKIDRIDRCGDEVRVIDYKSSVQASDKFEFADFETLFHDPAYDKQMQLMIYAWLLWKNGLATAAQIQPAIIPFKVFGDKPRHIVDSSKRALQLSDDFLQEFEKAFAIFVNSVFEQDLPFKQTENRDICEFCAYNVVCNFHP